MYLMYGTRVLLSFVILPTIISINHIEQTLSFVICNVFLIGPLIIGIIYAVIITIPIEKVEKEQLAKELERQIKKEQGYRYRILTIMLTEKVRECLWMNYISMIVI